MIEHRLGQMLVDKGLITLPQLQEALARQADKPHLRIGEILFSLGYITFNQLDSELERIHKDIRIGQLLLYRGLITHDELDHALNLQEKTGELLGAILVKMEFVTARQIDRALEEQRRFREGYEELRRALRRRGNGKGGNA